jgi:hypothetical protein
MKLKEPCQEIFDLWGFSSNNSPYRPPRHGVNLFEYGFEFAEKINTAAMLDLIFDRLWLPLKEISIEKTYIGKLSYTTALTRIVFRHSGVMAIFFANLKSYSKRL